MNKSEAELRRLIEWRKKRNITVEREKVAQREFSVEHHEVSNFHFFCYNPETNDLPYLSDVSLKRDDNADRAVLSIPVEFTEKNRTVYKRHDKSEFAFDVRLYLTPNNALIYPLRR